MEIRSLLQTHWGIFPTQVLPITIGLINQTWLVKSTAADFILQEINTEVFKEPAVLQEQLVDLSSSLELPNLVPLQYVQTQVGVTYITQENKTYRLAQAITPSLTLTTVTPQNARLAALALLEFHEALKSQSALNWTPPIARFLDVEFRLTSFEKAKTRASLSRKSLASEVISSLEADWPALLAWKQLSDQAEKVLIHADPKLSNFLFHPNGKQVRALIDWDTIQLGCPYYDYADMIRSFCSYGEDADTQGRQFKEEIFEALADTFAVDEEKLFTAALGVILVQATRFLTDYLQEDLYYKVNDELHNLRRAANQLRLAAELKNYWFTTRKPAL
jgi:thiamine kinase-like enzyme